MLLWQCDIAQRHIRSVQILCVFRQGEQYELLPNQLVHFHVHFHQPVRSSLYPAQQCSQEVYGPALPLSPESSPDCAGEGLTHGQDPLIPLGVGGERGKGGKGGKDGKGKEGEGGGRGMRRFIAYTALDVIVENIVTSFEFL